MKVAIQTFKTCVHCPVFHIGDIYKLCFCGNWFTVFKKQFRIAISFLENLLLYLLRNPNSNVPVITPTPHCASLRLHGHAPVPDAAGEGPWHLGEGAGDHLLLPAVPRNPRLAHHRRRSVQDRELQGTQWGIQFAQCTRQLYKAIWLSINFILIQLF